MITSGSLCTGYGGLDTAVERVFGARTVWHAEIDPAATQVLAAHNPDVPNLGDITTVDWTTVEPVDVLTTGFPCTDVSSAGKRAGIAPGTRSGLWLSIVPAIDVLRPRLVVIENVRGLLSARAHSDLEPCPWCVGDKPNRHVLRALGAVLGDLADLGYDAIWQGVPAAAIGAPHLRWRVFIIAWPATHTDRDTVWPPAVPVARRGGAPLPGDARAGVDVALLPTPNAALGRGTGTPSPQTAAARYDAGKRFLDDAVALLPTPTASDGTAGPGHAASAQGSPDLRTTAALLPTPRARDWKGRDPNPKGVDLNEAVALLPTPRATDGTKGGPNQRGSSGDLMLPSAVMLLPTPTVADSRGARNATATRSDPLGTTNHDGWTLSDVAHAERWGDYAPAIARWEVIMGRPAPDPTEPGTKGQPRLSARFVEWLMGLPMGLVTDHAKRNDALRILGNGVVPQQAEYALSLLLASMDICRPGSSEVA